MDAWFIWTIIMVVLALIALLIRRGAGKPVEFSEPRPTRSGVEGRNSYDADRLLEMEMRGWNQRKEQHEKAHKGRLVFRSLFKGIAVLFGGLAVFFLIMSSFVIVGTNQVGIMTEFGRPQTAYSNGFALKSPWAVKTEFDGTQQYLRFDGNGNDEEDLDKKVYPRMEVKLDGQAKAWISGNIAWQMKAGTKEEKANAVELFKTHRTFERLTKNLVDASARKAIGQVFALHNPLDATKNQTIGELNKMALEQLREEFKGQLNIISVDLRVPDYDDQTDGAISAMQAQRAKTKLAEEEFLTNQAKAKANAVLEASVQNPAVNVANCIQAAIQLNKEPGFCLMGSGSVMVNTSGQQK